MNRNDNNRPEDTQNGRLNQEMNSYDDKNRLSDTGLTPDHTLPYEDPAITNPEELASFPKKSKIADAGQVEEERESHLTNRRTPVREGRNITRTDNNPDTDGFM